MPRRSQIYGQPRDWLATGTFPTGKFFANTPDFVSYAVYIATKLEDETRELNRSSLCREVELERSTLYDILGGRVWPDTVSLSKLEMHLKVRLWPDNPPPLRRARRRSF
jgi:ribosome-binding protein aMBF1 (putative translation factor)